MYAQVEKTKKNSSPSSIKESRAVANSVGQKKSNGKQGFGVVDNRPKTFNTEHIQRMADDFINKSSFNFGNSKSLQSQLQTSLISGNKGGKTTKIRLNKGRNENVLQLTSLNGVQVQKDVKYPNNNQVNVLTHMDGVWDGVNGHAVTGGHLLDGIKNTWGPPVANSVPNGASPKGVHFEGGLPGNKITPHQHRFRLVHDNQQGANAVSNPKDSTFWPGDWKQAKLINTLDNSFRCGNATQWASKENTTYWYRWQTLGANTLFPIELIGTATGTDRNKSKAGRIRALAYMN
jgi:hypothetical protein